MYITPWLVGVVSHSTFHIAHCTLQFGYDHMQENCRWWWWGLFLGCNVNPKQEMEEDKSGAWCRALEVYFSYYVHRVRTVHTYITWHTIPGQRSSKGYPRLHTSRQDPTYLQAVLGTVSVAVPIYVHKLWRGEPVSSEEEKPTFCSSHESWR